MTQSTPDGDAAPAGDIRPPAGASAVPAAPAHAAAAPALGAKQFTLDVLNGLALGVVICLIPGALLGEVSKAVLPWAPWLGMVVQATTLATSAMGLVVGIVIGQMFKLSPIQSAAVGLATFYAAGAVTFVPGPPPSMTLKGAGDIITMGLTAAFAVWLVRLLGNGLKAYTMIVVPPFVTVIAGIVGRLILPYSLMVTAAIGRGVQYLSTLQPLVMGVLIAVAFAFLIMTPVTTVGIALMISLSGLGSGAGNVGICACAFGFAILGWKVNSRGTSLAHFIGSPKMSMANMLRKPKIMLPMLCAAAVSGLVSVLLGITGTPMSAGFGISGFVGPLGYFGLEGWSAVTLVKALVAFVVVPVATVYAFGRLFTKAGIVSPEDYRLDVQ